MKVTFWGCRGSMPCPGPNTVKYGGNTTCIEIRNDSNDLLILDAGSGIRELASTLMDECPLKATILISHTHWDHIQGFPFFTPNIIPGNEIKVFGPRDMVNNKSLKEVLSHQMNYAYFPIESRELKADIEYINQGAGPVAVEAFDITCRNVNHPVHCLGSKIQADGQTVVYTGDHEPYRDMMHSPDDDSQEAMNARAIANKQNREMEEFCEDADLLIADCQYTDEEYEHKVGWGHSSLDHCINLAKRADVDRVALTHHEPTRTDEEFDELEQLAKKKMAETTEQEDQNIEVFYAREKMTINL
ncbi:MAG: MBL fold metallo-hydrolase [bacterium]